MLPSLSSNFSTNTSITCPVFKSSDDPVLKNSSFGIAKYQPPTQSAFDVSEKERNDIYEKAWQEGGQAMLFAFTDLLTDEKANETAAEFVRNKIRKIVKNKRTAELLCPTNHPIGTKRLCLDSNYFETYNKENVSLIDVSNNPIEKITYNGLITNNTEYLFDDLVFATGFDAMTGAVNAIDIRNENDISLKSIWDKGPKTYLGIMVSNFPNLFMITGPQSPGVKSQMILSIEQHVDFVHNLIVHKQNNNFKNIWISRSKSKHRKIKNESEILPLLKKFNFEIVFPEEMTFEEQIKIYHGANIMGGLHGGGLTNILFMNPGTKLLEVRRENDNLNNCYYTLASELGINYYYVNSKSQGDDLYVSDTIINLIDLEKLLIKVTS